MNDDNRLEESRLDADRIDRLTRQLHSKHMFMQKIMLDSAAALDVMESRAEAAESAIAEARQDYANLASTSGDMLKLAVARAEKAEVVAELARRWLHCADVINETFGSHGPIKDTETLSRRNVEYMDATDAMCAAIRQTKGTT